jgi:hypothetical protein
MKELDQSLEFYANGVTLNIRTPAPTLQVLYINHAALHSEMSYRVVRNTVGIMCTSEMWWITAKLGS